MTHAEYFRQLHGAYQRICAKWSEKSGYPPGYLPYLCELADAPDGMLVQTLANRVGVTQQATGKMVGNLEREGLVVRFVSPHDARARVINLLQEGADALKHLDVNLEVNHAA